MTRLRWLTAGESHGPMLVAIVEGLPAGLPLRAADIDADLARRQRGHGRGGRMKIEKDQARIVTGVRFARTLGAPVALLVENKDWQSWTERMSVEGPEAGARVTVPRPGHADLSASMKYGYVDLRDGLERASARETTMRVALGAVARRLLAECGISIGSWVTAIGEVTAPAVEAIDAELAERDAHALGTKADASPVRCLDAAASEAMVARIDRTRRERDTVGGVFEVRATGVPPGLGSHVQADRRLDGRLAQALTMIQAIKAVEVGDGWRGAGEPGSKVHDPIARLGGGFSRPTNHAGGVEGGISNGQPIVVRAAMKPIATVPEALPSIDLTTGEVVPAHVERSDTCAVPAAAVVGEAALALALADALLETVGGDTLADVQRGVRALWKRGRKLPGHVLLAGMMGAGKSSAGAALAERLALPFVDLDLAIEAAAGRSVAELFAAEGEEGFRARERAALRLAASAPRSVIALGGGSLERNADLARVAGDVVWLDAKPETLAARLAGSEATRPLLAGLTPEAVVVRLTELAAKRASTYRLAADARVTTDGRTALEVAAACAQALEPA